MTLKIFGPHVGARIYSVLFMAYALTNFLQYLFSVVIVQPIKDETGYEIVYYIEIGFGVVNMIILWVVYEGKYNWKALNYEYYQKVGHDEYV